MVVLGAPRGSVPRRLLGPQVGTLGRLRTLNEDISHGPAPQLLTIVTKGGLANYVQSSRYSGERSLSLDAKRSNADRERSKCRAVLE